MRELSLFTGAGGGLLASKELGWATLGYVEINEYCQRVLAQRIKDGHLDEAPIFNNIKTFISDGYAKKYKGMVEIITAGFPCQPFSVAGTQKGEDDPRNMWPETIECIRRIRPQEVLLENVEALLSRKHKYFEKILSDLAESGYNARWKIISAAEVGAPHKRNRLWVFAYANCPQRKRGCIPSGVYKKNSYLSNTCWGKDKSGVDRSAYGMAYRLDRLRAIGNGQVPQTFVAAYNLLSCSTWWKQ